VDYKEETKAPLSGVYNNLFIYLVEFLEQKNVQEDLDLKKALALSKAHQLLEQEKTLSAPKNPEEPSVEDIEAMFKVLKS